MAVPFKMKGSPMQRNFGIGSPLHDEKEEKVVKGGTKKIVDVSGGDKPERHSDKYDRVADTKGSDDAKTASLAVEYGGTWSLGEDKNGNALFLNQDGKNVKQVAISQAQKKSQEKKDYIAANTTKN